MPSDLTRAQVVKLARKTWGPGIAKVTEYPDAPTPDERGAALRRMGECRKELSAMPLPNGNAEIAAQRRGIHLEIKKLEGLAWFYRYNLSKLMENTALGGFYRGYSGDSWRAVAIDAGLLKGEK